MARNLIIPIPEDLYYFLPKWLHNYWWQEKAPESHICSCLFSQSFKQSVFLQFSTTKVWKTDRQSFPLCHNDKTLANCKCYKKLSKFLWQHYSGIAFTSPLLSCISTIKNSRYICTLQYFKHLPKAGLHPHISLTLTALAGYSLALPGKKVWCFVLILCSDWI